jgi:hypothetical protein
VKESNRENNFLESFPQRCETLGRGGDFGAQRASGDLNNKNKNYGAKRSDLSGGILDFWRGDSQCAHNYGFSLREAGAAAVVQDGLGTGA